MTIQEQKTVDQLFQTVRELSQQNNLFKQEVKDLVNSINIKVEEKHLPINYEKNILNAVQNSIDNSILEALKGYNSPLTKLVNEVINSRNTQLKEIITTSFDEVISLSEFKQSIVSAFSHKVAKTIISNNDGLFDKVANDLKQDSIFKAKMQIAVSNVVEECLKNK